MKTQLSQIVRFLSILWWAALAVGSRASAQTSPGLDLQLYAGLSITGEVGTVYSVQYATDVAQRNAWRPLAFLQVPTPNYLWIDPSTPATGRRYYRAVAEARTNLVFIPPGTFRMGSPTNEVDRYDDEGPQTAVTISQGFWMGKYLVTQREYLAVVGSNPSYFHGGAYGTDLNRPVEQVSWNDATNYCAKRTEQETGEGLIPEGSHYRLPTETEQEYACRALTSDRRFYYGDDLGYAHLKDYAWYGANNGGTTHPVGQKPPNGWGLYDIVGNVQEWCQDWYGPYAGGTVTDPQGPASGTTRVARGGGLADAPKLFRSALRNELMPDSKFSFVGFRVVLVSGQP
jgi:formylglycine-generating enzyme required for sulfatase activity